MRKSLPLIPLLLATPLLSNAAPGHGDGHHDDHGSTDMHSGHGGHAHDSWVEPPADFAAMRWSGWDDTAAAARGKLLYQQNCAYCHGDSGKGDGVMAGRLAHGPADLTNHFHTAPGKGDGYLFWRLTEGARVEPFRSQDSAMPAFGTSLTEQQRWDVLTYVHQAFHGGFAQARPAMPMPSSGGHHDHSGHAH